MKNVYFTAFPGRYFTGDGARQDEDGWFWLMGRVDDVINVSGHRMGTAEVESALVSHPSVAEAAVVGYPHEIKGEGIYAYVILKHGIDIPAGIEKILRGHVREEIGPIASPDFIHIVPSCRRLAPARSCVAFCARSLRGTGTWKRSATSRRSRTHRLSRRSSIPRRRSDRRLTAGTLAPDAHYGPRANARGPSSLRTRLQPW